MEQTELCPAIRSSTTGTLFALPLRKARARHRHVRLCGGRERKRGVDGCRASRKDLHLSLSPLCHATNLPY